MDLSSYFSKDQGEGAEAAELVAVMQRSGKRHWAIYDASLLSDPGRRKRDPDLYLAERMAAGDTRVAELPTGTPSWAPDKDGKWRPQAAEDKDGKPLRTKQVTWTMSQKGLWSYSVRG